MISGEAQPQETKRSGREEVSKRIGSLIRDVRDRRRPREELMLRNHAAWSAKSIGREQYVSETFKHYIPVGRRATERFVVRVTQMLMPSPRFFEVFPGDEYDLQMGRSADSVRIFHEYNLIQRLGVRRIINALARTLFLYEQAILKTGVQVIDAPVQWGRFAGTAREVWPYMRAVDPFNFYVWPETVSSITEATLVFEDVMMPYQEYEAFAARGICDRIPQRDLGRPEWPHHHVARLAHMGLVEPGSGIGSAVLDSEGQPQRIGPMENFVALSEAYFKVRGRWWQAWLVWNVPESPRTTRLHTAPSPTPPYHMGTARPIPGELLTSGLMDDLEPLQILFNDQVNQGEEARAITSVPPVIIDPALVSRADSIKFGPRQRWYGSKDGFSIPNIPDVSQAAQRAQGITLSLINSLGGASAATEGAPTRGMPRAGFAVSQMLSLAMGEIKDAAEIIEQDCLTPALADMHRWALAFVPPRQIFSIPGAQDFGPMQMTLSDLLGSWHFKWVGTLQAQDKEVRSQRLIAGLQMLAKVEERMVQQGFMVNWPQLIKMAWRDGLGERGVEQVIVPMPPELIEQMARSQAAEGGGVRAPGAGAGANAPGSAEEAMRALARTVAETSLGG